MRNTTIKFYKFFTDFQFISNSDYNYNTLEPKLLKANGLDKLNRIFGTAYTDEDDLRKFMKHNKTECGLKIFESSEQIEIPEYIFIPSVK